MLYSVQNEFGRVYGIWPVPGGEELSSEEWELRLKVQLADSKGIKSVHTSSLVTSSTGESHDRVVIEVRPDLKDIALEDVQVAVGMVALLFEIEENEGQ
jgi:hypothetical protein